MYSESDLEAAVAAGALTPVAAAWRHKGKARWWCQFRALFLFFSGVHNFPLPRKDYYTGRI